MTALGIIGCGFVADLYMRSLAKYPHIKVAAVFDHDAGRLHAFCDHWKLPKSNSLNEFFAAQTKGSLVLNLTNPSAHFEISRECLINGFHVYSEKPLALEMVQARALYDLAKVNNLYLASAPCSVLGEAAQTLAHAIRNNMIGTPRLVFAELDDGFISQAPYESWKSESGAPWPWRDEFQVGCTLEHAGYYLTWLIAIFGPVEKLVAASAEVLPDKGGSSGTPDFSTATLFFNSGPVARLTCSIVAPHDHQIKVIGDKGYLRVKKAWDNSASVRFHRRLKIRRRLIEHPVGRRVRLKSPTHLKVSRKGAAAMNFALGPIDLLEAISQKSPARLSADFALHLNEVTLAIQNSGAASGAQSMTTSCKMPEPMPWAI